MQYTPDNCPLAFFSEDDYLGDSIEAPSHYELTQALFGLGCWAGGIRRFSVMRRIQTMLAIETCGFCGKEFTE